MEVEVLDLSQKPNCVNEKEITEFPAAMDLSQKVEGATKSSGNGIYDEDYEEMMNQLLDNLNNDESKPEAIDACKKFLYQLDEKLRNEETVEMILAQMKLSQKSLPPPSPSPSSITAANNRVNGINQSGPNGTNYSRHSSVDNMSNNGAAGSMGNNRSSSNQLVAGNNTNNSGSFKSSDHHGLSTNTNKPQTVSTHLQQQQQASSGQQRMTREMAMQALDQQYMARKALLRKQADKALSDIPLARHPSQTNSSVQPDLNIIPSTATNEFVALVGLEEVVKNLQEFRNAAYGQKTTTNLEVQKQVGGITPFLCVQCGTDFTPLWKRERQNSSTVVCETCCGLNYKKAIQKDYQDKIRMVLKKYQDQERDLDRDYKDMLDSPKKFELFRKEQEKKMFALTANNQNGSNTVNTNLPNQASRNNNSSSSNNNNSTQSSLINSTLQNHQQQQQVASANKTNNNTSTTNNPSRLSSSSHHHHQQHHHSHHGHHGHRSSNGGTNNSTSTNNSSSNSNNNSRQSQQQNQHHQSNVAAVAPNQSANQVAAAAAAALNNNQLTMDQLAYMQMLQTLSQFSGTTSGGSTTGANSASSRQQQQLMQQILQVAYMSSAAAAANNPFVQLISNMAAGLMSNQTLATGLSNGSTDPASNNNSNNNNAVLSYYLSMLQQQQAAQQGNIDK